MPLNFMSIGLTLSDLPEFCGPSDLAALIISLREQQREQNPGFETTSISDDGIRRLINLAYHTSLISEEGRFPKFRIVSHPKDDIRTIADCDVALDSVESLRKIAPTVSGDHNVALLVQDDTGPLKCIGLTLVDDMGFSVTPGRPEIVSVGMTPTFYLRVEGPGRIRCCEASTPLGAVRLVGGRLSQVIPYSAVKGVRALLTKLGNQTLAGVVAIKGEGSRKWWGGKTRHLVEKALAHTLEDTTTLGHGGAFIFLPTVDNDAEAFDIHCKYRSSLDIGKYISEFWCTCIECTEATDEKERGSALRNWRWRRARLFSSAAALSGLSAVDGCVVLNHNFNVLGFGGVIGLGESDPKVVNSPRRLKNVVTGEIYDDSEIASLGLGTRHRSAFRFCKAHANALVFVISQDGDLRVFYSDEEFVYGFERLFAWVNELDAV